MLQKDNYGNLLDTESAAAREAYDQGVRLFLSAQHGAVQAFEAAVAAAPRSAFGWAALARARMMAGDMTAARTALREAEACAEGGDARAQSHVAALGALFAADSPGARQISEAHVRDYPRDAMTAQLCTNVFGLIGFSGKVGREAELLAFTSALLPHYGEDWWMMSMQALSLCETGQVAASQTLMEQALKLNPQNAHGAHFKAHAQYEAGETAAGRAYLKEWLEGYDARGLLHGHLSWHRALWALHAGDETEMWALANGPVGPHSEASLPINVITDSAALMYRAELAGFSVAPERWEELSDYALKYFPNPGQSFVDMHAALCHAMAGRGEALTRLVESSKGFAADLVRPVARAWYAMARGDWQGALEGLVPVLAESERIGGSRAQRDLLELSYVMALLRLGRGDEAGRMIAMRRPVLTKHVKGWRL